MKDKLLILLLLVHGVTFAQWEEFKAATVAYEEGDMTKTLILLAAAEAKSGPNPRIESLKATAYEEKGDKDKAYLSVLRYMKMVKGMNLAGNEAHESLLQKEQYLKESIDHARSQEAASLRITREESNKALYVAREKSREKAFSQRKASSDAFFDTKITSIKRELTPEEIGIIKKTLQTEVTARLNVKTLNAANISFAKNLYIGQGYEVFLEQMLASTEQTLRNNERIRKEIRKSGGIKLKSEKDFASFMASIRAYYSSLLSKGYGQSNWSEVYDYMREKYKFVLRDINFEGTTLDDLTFILSSPNIKVSFASILYTNGKVSSIYAERQLNDDFETNTEIGHDDMAGFYQKMQQKYGSVEEEIVKERSVKNDNAFTRHIYHYTVKTGTVTYKLIFRFEPYGRTFYRTIYAGAIPMKTFSHEIIDGQTLRHIGVTVVRN